MGKDIYIKTKEAAQILSVGTETIRQYAISGRIKCHKYPTGRRRLLRESVMELAISCKTT